MVKNHYDIRILKMIPNIISYTAGFLPVYRLRSGGEPLYSSNLHREPPGIYSGGFHYGILFTSWLDNLLFILSITLFVYLNVRESMITIISRQ